MQAREKRGTKDKALHILCSPLDIMQNITNLSSCLLNYAENSQLKLMFIEGSFQNEFKEAFKS